MSGTSNKPGSIPKSSLADMLAAIDRLNKKCPPPENLWTLIAPNGIVTRGKNPMAMAARAMSPNVQVNWEMIPTGDYKRSVK